MRTVAHRDGRRRVLLSTVSSDSHTWNLVFLRLLLEEAGHEVVGLGPCVPDRLLIDSVRRVRPDLLVISTVNGHGQLDGARVIRALRADPEVGDTPAVIGGKLGVDGDAGAPVARALVEAGFDAVFTDGADTGRLAAILDALPQRAPEGRAV
ncbi:methylmalonyl-CoA mutase [Streptomyces sp. SID5785]|uniref:cobalamin B12-binding domain-containing protein n=1 Tax=Streptomyces sp. SID5785 TaxID=2690309 RepID=UPI001361EF6E|nr:cobalamin-dependent protein [Streptomyces sp. SID5785]MZD07206.1 methylmalonyl-CoA mutase [Streptomyces sp. SID5785]